jgi:hypothetical protein
VFGNPLASENSTDPASLGYSSVSTGAENVRHRSTFQLSRQHAFVGPACFWPVQISRNWAHQVHVNLSFLPGRLPQRPRAPPRFPTPQIPNSSPSTIPMASPHRHPPEKETILKDPFADAASRGSDRQNCCASIVERAWIGRGGVWPGDRQNCCASIVERPWRGCGA